MSWTSPFVNLALKAAYRLRRSDERQRGPLGGKVLSRTKAVSYTDPKTGETVRGKLVTSGAGHWEGRGTTRQFVPDEAHFVLNSRQGEADPHQTSDANRPVLNINTSQDVRGVAPHQTDAERMAADNPTTHQMQVFITKANAKLAELHTPHGSEPEAPRREVPAKVGRNKGEGNGATVPAAGGGGGISATLTVLVSYNPATYTFATKDLTFTDGPLTDIADGTPIVLSTQDCSSS